MAHAKQQSSVFFTKFQISLINWYGTKFRQDTRVSCKDIKRSFKEHPARSWCEVSFGYEQFWILYDASHTHTHTHTHTQDLSGAEIAPH